MRTYYRPCGKEPVVDLCKGRLGSRPSGLCGFYLSLQIVSSLRMTWLFIKDSCPGDPTLEIPAQQVRLGGQESVFNKHWANVVLRVPTSNRHKPLRFRFCSYFTDKQTKEQRGDVTYAQSYSQEESTFLTTDPGQLLNHTEPWVSSL